MATVGDPYWREREGAVIHGQGAITLCGMTIAECKKAGKRKKKTAFGFQAPPKKGKADASRSDLRRRPQ